MSGSIARQDMARIARHSGWAQARGARFLKLGGARPDFATLHALPRWPVLDCHGQERVAMVALLLSGRSALTRTIDGAQLRGYAGWVGPSVLERILMEDNGGRDPLPSVEALPDRARALLASHDAAVALARAEKILREMDAWPST